MPVPLAASPLSRPPRVLVLGMPKCGTTSLHEAFRSAGFSSVHWALDVGQDSRADKQLRLWGVGAERRMIAKLMLHASEDGLPPLAYLPPDVDAVAEMNGLFWLDKQGGEAFGFFPQMSLLDQLVDHYPLSLIHI